MRSRASRWQHGLAGRWRPSATVSSDAAGRAVPASHQVAVGSHGQSGPARLALMRLRALASRQRSICLPDAKEWESSARGARGGRWWSMPATHAPGRGR